MPHDEKRAMVELIREAAKERTERRRYMNEMNHVSNAGRDTYIDGDDTFNLGDAFIA